MAVTLIFQNGRRTQTENLRKAFQILLSVLCMVLVMCVSLLFSSTSTQYMALGPVPVTPTQRHIIPLQTDSKIKATILNTTISSEFTTASSLVCEQIELRPEGSLPLVALNSFPGSGNTWTRFIIERLSGICTGSVYCDHSLLNGGFKGECTSPISGRTVVVKIHELQYLKKFPAASWHRAIYLMRNPYDALISKRNFHGGRGHTAIAPDNKFKGHGWKEFVNLQINLWARMYDDALRIFDDILVVHYEDLRTDLERQIRRIAQFLRLNETVSSTTTLERRVQCTLANYTGRFKRKHMPLSPDPYSPYQKVMIDRKIGYVFRKLKEKGHPLPPYNVTMATATLF